MFLKVLVVVNLMLYDQLVSCQDASLTIVTRANYQLEKLKFGCSPTQPTAWSSLSHVTLSKNTSATTTQDIVTVILQFSPLQNKTTWVPGAGNWQSRAQIIKQYAQPIAGSGIEFDIPAEQVLCSDEGTYNCKISGQNTATQPIERTQSGTLSFIVNPTSIDRIRVNPPQVENIYNALTTVTLTCSGTVGRPAGDLTWCFRKPNDINFSGWPFTADINQDAPTPTGCQNFRTSRLTYNVSAADEYYEFKCVTGSTSCNNFDGLSANITIYRYTPPGTNPQTSDTSNAGAIAGGVIGAFVAIVVVVIIIYFVVFRNKGKGETYRTKEENGTGSAPIDNTVYSVPHKERDRHKYSSSRNPEQDEQLLNNRPPPPPNQPPKHELHYADLDIASNPPGVPPPKPIKPKPMPRSKNKEPPTEYAVVEFK